MASIGGGLQRRSGVTIPSEDLSTANKVIIPCPPTLTKDEDATLKSALGFVVLRRRLKERDRTASTSAASVSFENSGAALGRKRGRSALSLLSSTEKPAAAAPAASLPGGGTGLSCRIRDKSHISALVRLAISTALPVHKDVLGISSFCSGEGGNPNGRACSIGQPPLYDPRTGPADTDALVSLDTSTSGTNSNASEIDRARRIALLDGLAANIACQLATVATVSTEVAARIIQEEFLNSVLEEYGDGCINDGEESDEPLMGYDDGRLRGYRVIVAICTVLHRVYFNTSIPAGGSVVHSAIFVAISSFLRRLYDGDRSYFKVWNGKGKKASSSVGTVTSRSIEYDNDLSDNEMNDDFEDNATPILRVIEVPGMSDTLAVNLLTLLENLALTCARDLPSKRFSIVENLQEGFGVEEITYLPLPFGIKEVASFLQNERLSETGASGGTNKNERCEKKHAPLLDAGAKLMMRLTLWDLVGKLA